LDRFGVPSGTAAEIGVDHRCGVAWPVVKRADVGYAADPGTASRHTISLAAHRGLESLFHDFIPPFDVEGLCCDEPLAFDAVVREVVEILNRIDSNPHLHDGLRRRCEIDKQDLLKAWCILGFWRRTRSELFL
jgi:hypothetical protein